MQVVETEKEFATDDGDVRFCKRSRLELWRATGRVSRSAREAKTKGCSEAHKVETGSSSEVFHDWVANRERQFRKSLPTRKGDCLVPIQSFQPLRKLP